MMYQAPQIKLQSFIQHLETATREKQQSTAIFEEIRGGKELDKIALLNHRLSQDSNYPLPEGFVKYKERGPVLIYEIDEEKAKFIGEPTLLAYSLVDELLSKLFGFHVTEPKTAIKDQVKAKALFQKTVPIAGRFES